MSDSYYPEKRKVAENEANLDLKKPVVQLLADVHDESLDSRQPDAQRLGRVMARFASLLAVLSAKQEVSSKRLERFTLWLVILTVVLSVLTTYLCVEAYQSHQNHKLTNQQPAQKP